MAMSSELRRMQSGVSPFEHPGVYSHIDQLVTMHELPSSWGGPLEVSGTSGNVLIADHVKLAFLAEAIWEFTKRKCAEVGGSPDGEAGHGDRGPNPGVLWQTARGSKAVPGEGRPDQGERKQVSFSKT
jgi:hypothetical protein